MKHFKNLALMIMILFLTVNFCSFSKFSFNISKSFSLTKKATVDKKHSITYSIKPEKNILKQINEQVVLRDKYSPGTILEKIFTLPSFYWTKGKKTPGFPLKKIYKEVTALSWEYKNTSKYIYQQVGMISDYNTGNVIRNGIQGPICSAPTFKYTCNLEENNPIIQTIGTKRCVFFATLDQGIVSLDAITGEKLWNFLLTPGNSIIPGMSSFEYKNHFYLVFATEQKKVTLLDAENGQEISVIFTESQITSPLSCFHHNNSMFVAFTTKDSSIIIDVFTKEIILESNKQFDSKLSPICIWSNNQQSVVFPSQNGSIFSLGLDTNETWMIQLDGQINFNLTYVAWDGVPYISCATSQKKVIVINGCDGDTIYDASLSGVPKSVVMFYPQQNIYYVAIQNDRNTYSEMKFVSGGVLDGKKQKEVRIPGKQLFGFCGLEQNGVHRFLFLNEERDFFSLFSGDKIINKFYPLSLSSIGGSIQSMARGICASIVQDMIWIVVPGEGIYRFGNPFKRVDNKELNSVSPFSTCFEDANSSYHTSDAATYSIDRLPSTKNIYWIKQNIVLKEKSSPLPIPTCFWDVSREEWFFVTINAKGHIAVRDESMQIRYLIETDVGKTLVSPIVEIDENNNWLITVISEKKLINIIFDPENEHKELLWEAADMKSVGSSFQIFKYKSLEYIIFVNDIGYLTALNRNSGEQIFKNKVNSKTFCTYFVKQKPVIFCGDKIVDAINGETVSNYGEKGSDSTITTLSGKILWLQSFEDDMICKNASNGEIEWKVRKLLCKNYCFKSTSPAIYKEGKVAFSYWSDYNRIVCVDLYSGLIRWRIQLSGDYVVEKPIVVDTNEKTYVVISTVAGNIYLVDAWSGKIINGYPIKMPSENRNLEYTGISTIGCINGAFIFSKVGDGWYMIGKPKSASNEYPSKIFKVQMSKQNYREQIFNRAELYWSKNMCYSNIVKIPKQ
ncbi:MAG: PQQ-binding-like beta-propeller repeat protein [Caldisericia bacterium]|nr:PQQ-binding-like beta-propeller repeat protein [Caldisericia bacterium]